MNAEQLYAEMNKRIEKRLKSDAQLAGFQKKQMVLGKAMNAAALAGQKRIEAIVKEEFLRTLRLITSG